MRWRVIPLFISLGAMVCLVGCKVHVDNGASADQKKVQVDTPFGGIRVNTGQTTAADVGLPAYPGAQLVTDDKNHDSADVHMGFGQWELRVQVASYSTADDQDKVEAFYRKALRSYGDVIACRNDVPVGTPAQTSEGLTCSDHGHAKVNVNDHGENYGYHSEHGSLELKSGSERHQHIVSFDSTHSGQTRFALVNLDLPGAASGASGKSD
ncbi:MAG TPA: hypothetical protein VGR47_00130 [Terracidiphilus sp.]|nr:hypothetical protein [Terracidiphilus sp.]